MQNCFSKLILILSFKINKKNLLSSKNMTAWMIFFSLKQKFQLFASKSNLNERSTHIREEEKQLCLSVFRCIYKFRKQRQTLKQKIFFHSFFFCVFLPYLCCHLSDKFLISICQYSLSLSLSTPLNFVRFVIHKTEREPFSINTK